MVNSAIPFAKKKQWNVTDRRLEKSEQKSWDTCTYRASSITLTQRQLHLAVQKTCNTHDQLDYKKMTVPSVLETLKCVKKKQIKTVAANSLTVIEKGSYFVQNITHLQVIIIN